MKKTRWLFSTMLGIFLTMSLLASTSQVDQEMSPPCSDVEIYRKYNRYSADSLILSITRFMKTSDSELPCLIKLYRQKFVGPGQELTSQYYFNALANYHYRKNNADSVRTYVQLALACDSILGDERLKAIDMGILANLAFREGRLDDAIRMYQEQLRTLDPEISPTNVSSVYNNLGVSYLKKGYLETAMSCFEEALMVNDLRRNDYADESRLNLKANIGIIHRRQTRFTESLVLFKEVFRDALRDGYTYPQHLSLANIGHSYLEMGRLDSARFWLQRAFDFALSNGFDREAILLNLANTERQLGDWQAFQWCLNQLDTFYQEENLKWLPENYLLAAYAAEERGAMAEYAAFLEKGLELAKTGTLDKSQIHFEELLAAHNLTNNRPWGIKLLQSALSHKDSLYQMNNQTALADMIAKYQVDRIQQELEGAKKEAEIQKGKKRLYQTRFGFTVCGLAFIILSFIFYHRQAITHKKNLELEVKILFQKAKTSEIENEVHRRKILDKDLELTLMMNTVEELVDKYAPNARLLKRKIHMSFSKTKGRSQFRHDFDMLFPHFTPSLLSVCFDLTTRQLEYSMLISLGLSCKEIAEILFVTTKSVEKMRSRLTVMLPFKDHLSLSIWLRNLLINPNAKLE
jgi:tetratricopeptide (TPR) repeat protein